MSSNERRGKARPEILIHVDYGTKGNSGFYLREVLAALDSGYEGVAYVHRGFVAPSLQHRVRRVFGRFERLPTPRLIKDLARLMDIYLQFFLLLRDVKRLSKEGNVYVFIALFQSFHVYSWFVRQVKRWARVVVTVHDVVPHANNYPGIIMSDPSDVVGNADALIVHQEKDRDFLVRYEKPIFCFPFPIAACDMRDRPRHVGIRFLFIGAIRREKGLDVLLSAWRKIDAVSIGAHLKIAGVLATSQKFDFGGLVNCSVHDGYVSEEDFEKYILECDYVVLPYVGGTNSGVFSVATSLSRPCVTSSLPVFASLDASIPELRYAGGAGELAAMLVRVTQRHDSAYSGYQSHIYEAVARHREGFRQKLNDVYREIIAGGGV